MCIKPLHCLSAHAESSLAPDCRAVHAR
jgi:hypothetical protein